MYSRSFYNEKDGNLNPPENYDGNAFKDRGGELSGGGEPTGEKAVEASGTITEKEEKAKGGISSLFSSSIFSGLFPSGKIPFLSSLSLPKIGTEEILIIAAAAYLFFSKDGDKECAIMLILLLFVN